MAVSSWMLRNRTLRSGRFDRSRKENDEDYVNIDLSKDARKNCKEILEGICNSSSITEARRVNYLNAFVKLILHVDGTVHLTGFTIEEIFCCLRVSLLNESTQVRAAGLRAIRHVLSLEDDVMILNNLQFPYLIARSIDLVLRNDSERIQAFKLIRKILLICPKNFDVTLVRTLVSLANGVGEDKDRMLRVCLAALCELGILNSDLFISCGGVAAITRNILECQMPRIVECLCGVLLHLLDKSPTRNFAGIDLHCLAAPYCDFHYRHAWMDKNRDERELRFNCSRLALLSVLRSWPGILQFCSPANTSGLQAIVDVLYLNQLEVRKAVLDLLYELLGLPQPEWTDEYSVALNAVDPSDPQDTWRLSEGFVAAEGRSIMPHQARTTPNIAEIHLAVLLYIFLELGLLSALVEVIVTSDTFISVRATVLLGELLHMIHLLLPPECCDITPALPNLLAYSTTNSYQALAAVTALHQLHSLLKQRPASSSLYLDHILHCGRLMKTTTSTGERVKRHKSHSTKSKIYQLVLKDGDEYAIRESGVLQRKEGLSWNWNIIRAILKSDGDFNLRMDDSNHRAFLRRLVHYYYPSSNRYSHLDLSGPNQSHVHTTAGCDLVHCLLSMPEVEGSRLLLEWFADITSHVDAITSSKSAHDCLFSPLHMSNTLCQTYFLFIGHMCHTSKGISILQDLGLFQKLMSLSTTTNHSCYVKLIVSSFNYMTDGVPRQILARVLICQQESSRLYATQFLLVLLRAGLRHFEQWGVELLVTQLFDQSKAVSLIALSILHEACEQKSCLEKLVTLKPDLLHLGDKGLLLLIRFLSVPSGFELLNKDQFVCNEIKRWAEHFNYKYVRLMESELLDSLTLHQRSEYGRYDRRHSTVRAGANVARRDVYVLPHLYSQLVQHAHGRATLVHSGTLEPIFKCVRLANCGTEQEILELKSALWACGHIASSTHGVDMLSDVTGGEDLFTAIIKISEYCPVYSIRGTAIYILGLMATTFKGANTLFSMGWACVRHNRHDRWPVIEEEDWSHDHSSLSSCFDMPTTSRSESDRTSSDNTFWTDDMITHDFPLLAEIDGSIITTDEDSQLIHKKSSTLPYSSNNSGIQHRRTLSESKTVDAIKKLDQPNNNNSISNTPNELIVPHRRRDNSCTESTTSGVSSCDSVLGKYVINERVQTLSPIPSSSSLSTLKTGLEFRRQNSEGVRRVSLSIQSSSASNSLTVSPPDPSLSRLSHQDLVGYNTLRTLRRVRLSSRNSAGKEDPITSLANSRRSNSLSRQLSSSGFDDDPLENALFGGPESLPISGTHKLHQPIRDCSRETGRIYMGICLPRQFGKLFPNDKASRRLSFVISAMDTDDQTHYDDDSSEMTDYSLTESPSTSKRKQRLFKHKSRICLVCCREHKPKPKEPESPSPKSRNSLVYLLGESGSYAEIETKLKLEILKHAERLSNPVLTKQSKQALLHLKQRHPSSFQDICIYSEICNMVGLMTYRLNARRFLQELFLDLKFEHMYSEPNEILRNKTFEKEPEKQIVNLEIVPKSVSRADDDLIQRCNELSDLVRRTANFTVFVADSNRNVTKGFSIENRPRGGTDMESTRATSPLTSVAEEPIVHHERSGKNSEGMPRLNRNTLDSLKLTCIENKFPITNRASITRTSSYGSKSLRSPITKQSAINQSITSSPPSLPNNIPTSKLAET